MLRIKIIECRKLGARRRGTNEAEEEGHEPGEKKGDEKNEDGWGEVVRRRRRGRSG